MERFSLENDIKVLFITAKSFPDGVLEAHQKLHSLIPFTKERKYFGLSRPNMDGAIIYKAAAEEINNGEAEKLGCETLIIKSGLYIYQTINDYMKNLPAIGQIFKKLISSPGIDPDGY